MYRLINLWLKWIVFKFEITLCRIAIKIREKFVYLILIQIFCSFVNHIFVRYQISIDKRSIQWSFFEIHVDMKNVLEIRSTITTMFNVLTFENFALSRTFKKKQYSNLNFVRCLTYCNYWDKVNASIDNQCSIVNLRRRVISTMFLVSFHLSILHALFRFEMYLNISTYQNNKWLW